MTSIPALDKSEATPAEQDFRPGKAGGLFTRRRAWGLTGLLVTLGTINNADKAVLGIIAQPLAKDLGLTASQIGLAGSLFFLTFAIGGFFAGTVNRLVSLRWALVILALGWSLTVLPLIVSASFAVLIVSRLVLGLFEGPAAALSLTAAYSWHEPSKRGLPGALIAGAQSIAKIAIAPALAVVTATLGWRAALSVLAVAGLIWCVVWIFTWREGPYIRRESAKAEPVGTEASEPTVPWRKIFLNRTFISAAVLITSCYAMVAVVLTWLPSYFELGLGFSRLQAGLMFAIPSAVGLVLMLSISTISDRLLVRGASLRTVRIVMPVVGVFICGLLLFLLPSIGSAPLAVLVVSVGYGFCTPVMPLFSAMISDLCPPRQTAGTLGFFLAIMATGGLVAPYATGVIVDHAPTAAQGYALSFQILGAIAAACAVLVLILANPARDRQRA
ncbi:MFS transporter [Rhodococcus tukisamuensis]|uniref:Sugar phosphate permease n=1 Tax=Rhodococcus tukisamuensis TaxID=168276 RepID=A0A1G6W8M4_9NOCA|nr:MFS transporter [Rhodococcus tukisamuensis]SDD62164.1 Sugar phosphate permease [Rhodococcus tukisamuensis]